MAEINKPVPRVPITDYMCYTKVNLKECTFLWTIENLSVHKERNTYQHSSRFSAVNDEFKWQLRLDPYNETVVGEQKTGWISIDLETVGEIEDIRHHLPITGKLKMSIINSKNVKTCTKNKDFVMSEITESVKSSDLYAGFEKFFAINRLSNNSELFPDDRLTIYCELSYVKRTDIENISSGPFSKCNEERPELDCLNGIESLLMNKEFSDVTLIVEGKKYPAHKSILVARCPVFRAAFAPNMEKTECNSIDIKDIKVSAFKELLRYIYTGQVENMREIAPELLAAADKYDLKILKNMCEKELYENLSVETAMNTLMLAHKYHAKNLKKKALLFIKMHSCNSELLDEKQRESLLPFPNLLWEILHILGIKCISNK